MVLLSTVSAENQATPHSAVTLHPPAVAGGNQPRPTARPGTQHPTDLEQALLRAETEVTVVLWGQEKYIIYYSHTPVIKAGAKVTFV